MAWAREFDQPIPTDGKPLRTLRDAAAHILTLSKAKQRRAEWQAAGEAVIMAAEDRGPILHADIGMRRALGADKKAAAAPKDRGGKSGRKRPTWAS